MMSVLWMSYGRWSSAISSQFPGGFSGRWHNWVNALAERVGPALITHIDPEKVWHGLIVHDGMLAHPRVITMLLNMLSPQDRHHVRQMGSLGHGQGVTKDCRKEGLELPQHFRVCLQNGGGGALRGLEC
jgi:hypothetical protein